MHIDYRRNLPHILPVGATIFFTFRLADSIALAALQQLADTQELAIIEAIRSIPTLGQQADAISRIKKQ